MKKILGLSFWAALALATSPLHGQGLTGNTLPLEVTVTPATYQPGDVVTLTFTVQVPEHYHVYSVEKVDGPLPTSLIIDTLLGAQLQETLKDMDTPLKKYEEVFSTDVLFFEGKAQFTQQVKVLQAGAQLHGLLKYMYCDDKQCILGSNELTLGFTGTGLDLQAKLPPPPTAQAAPVAADQGPGANLAWVFLQAFLFGFVALLTPCVYPMVPMTVSYFVKMSGTRRQGIQRGLLYALSIILIYVVVGLLITLIFGPTALYQTASNPTVNLIFFAIILLFGLSFLGLFNLTLPGSWTNALDTQASKGGVAGLFFMALTLALVSFSCTGPLIGTLLIEAAGGGSLLGPTMGMLGFATAFALPFGLLAIFPSWLSSLPKSGGWLGTVKVTLGFLELALALKFLSNADLVLHWGFLNREVYLAAWIVIFFMLGLYLLGKLRLAKEEPLTQGLGVPRLMMSMVTFMFVLYLIPGLWGAPLSTLSNLLPNTHPGIGVKLNGDYESVINRKLDRAGSGGTGATTVAADVCDMPRKYQENFAEATPLGYCAFYDLEEGLAYARQVGKPVLLDFTGHTCVNCRNVEAQVWTKPEIRQIITQKYVLISLYVDDSTPLEERIKLPSGQTLRTVGDKWLNHEITTYGVIAQPYYVAVNPTTGAALATIAYETNANNYAAFLSKGLEAFRAGGATATR